MRKRWRRLKAATDPNTSGDLFDGLGTKTEKP